MRPCLFPAIKQPRDTGLHDAHAVVSKARTDSEDDVAGRGKQVAVEPEHFPEQSLDPVATDRAAGLLLDADAEPASFALGRQDNHGKPVAPYPPASPVNALEIPGGPEQILFRQRVPAHPLQAASCLRPLALLRLMTA